MDFDRKVAHRKSRAPWQNSEAGAKISNPYANANTSLLVEDKEDADSGNVYRTNVKPKTRRNRRLSIHASAVAAGQGRPMLDVSNLPPVPQLPTNNSSASIVDDSKNNKFVNTESKIAEELENGTATEIDEYYQLLTKQKGVINRDIKSNIDKNQKHILELTNNLKSTQEELLSLRTSTNELYEVLGDFKKAAQRRVELEDEASSQDHRNDASSQRKPLSKRKDRSSVIVLEKMWIKELQSLCKHVEGASKYVQPLPGRHVLSESGRWLEVNVGTWKPTRSIHIFVLNDMVLIATKKNSALHDGNKKVKLLTLNCWPLHDVNLLEVPTPSNTARNENDDGKVYLINLRAKGLSYVYQTDRYDHYLKVLEAFSKAKNELSMKEREGDINGNKQKDNSDSNDQKKQLRDSWRNSGFSDTGTDDKRKSGQRYSSEVVLQDISAKVHSRHKSNDFSVNNGSLGSKAQYFNELRKIDDRIDEIDVEIAHDKYTESVGLIRYIENKLSSIELSILRKNWESGQNELDELRLLIDVIKLKLSTRKNKIQQNLAFCFQYKVDVLTDQEISSMVEFFHIFDQLEKGVSLYFQSMSNQLSMKVSKLSIGVQSSTKVDVTNYLSNLVIIHVSVIKRAVTTFKSCFLPILTKDKTTHVNSSWLVNWTVDEANKLVNTIKKHLVGTLLTVKSHAESEEVSYVVKDRELFDEFLVTITQQLNELKKIGINIDYLFEDILLSK